MFPLLGERGGFCLQLGKSKCDPPRPKFTTPLLLNGALQQKLHAISFSRAAHCQVHHCIPPMQFEGSLITT
jgi:hypothetical protein